MFGIFLKDLKQFRFQFFFERVLHNELVWKIHKIKYLKLIHCEGKKNPSKEMDMKASNNADHKKHVSEPWFTHIESGKKTLRQVR